MKKEKLIGVTVRFSEAKHKKLLKLAQAEGRKIAGYIRYHVEQMLDKAK